MTLIQFIIDNNTCDKLSCDKEPVEHTHINASQIYLHVTVYFTHTCRLQTECIQIKACVVHITPWWISYTIISGVDFKRACHTRLCECSLWHADISPKKYLVLLCQEIPRRNCPNALLGLARFTKYTFCSSLIIRHFILYAAEPF